MDVFSSSPTCFIPLPSISLPTRFNHLAETIDVSLQKVKSWLQASAASTPSDNSLSNGLAELSRVSSLVENLLQVPTTQRMIIGIRGKNCIDVVLNGYVGLLEACNVIRELLMMTKERSQGLHSVFRRKGANRATTCSIDAFVISRGSKKKIVHQCLYQSNQVSENCSRYSEAEKDPETLVLLKVMGDVIIISASVLSYLLTYFLSSCGNWCPWKVSTRFLLKNRVNRGNVLSQVDDSIHALRMLFSGKGGGDVDGVAMRETQRRLKAVEEQMDHLEIRLENVFKGMIQNRVSLLNIISN
ncbi:hypothetical protein ZOSMA_47G00270 [Zostera marina]|uniref:Uncharacterized protein n=1 Tax=Zostera marina TaxID=29655 RepID=A0A0K9P1Y4_ZOSMR|nr:hypothetical protein ZOSMA_47G00270 [Zostera marina]